MEFRDEDLSHYAAHGTPPLPTPVRELRVSHAGASIWCGVYGEGAPVLLLHGAFNQAADWSRQIAALTAAGYGAIAIDNRGRGRSTLGAEPLSYALEAEEVLAVMDALELPAAAIVGWSDGAIIGLTLAMRHPQRVGRVFAFGTVMHLDGLKPLDMDDPVLGRMKHEDQRPPRHAAGAIQLHRYAAGHGAAFTCLQGLHAVGCLQALLAVDDIEDFRAGVGVRRRIHVGIRGRDHVGRGLHALGQRRERADGGDMAASFRMPVFLGDRQQPDLPVGLDHAAVGTAGDARRLDVGECIQVPIKRSTGRIDHRLLRDDVATDVAHLVRAQRLATIGHAGAVVMLRHAWRGEEDCEGESGKLEIP